MVTDEDPELPTVTGLGMGRKGWQVVPSCHYHRPAASPEMAEEVKSPAHQWNGDDQSLLGVGKASTSESASSSSPHLAPSSPLPRSSTDSEGRPAFSSVWNDTTSLDRRDTLATIHSVDQPSLVEPGFDESILRALCELDVSRWLYYCLYILENDISTI